MDVDDVVAKFQAAHEELGGPIVGQPTYDDLRRIRELLYPLLLEIPYDEEQGKHNLVGLILPAAEYKKEFGRVFVRPTKPGAYDDTIAADANNRVRAEAEAKHKAKQADHRLYAVAERESRLFLTKNVEDTWTRELWSSTTYYTKVTALQLLEHLTATCPGTHGLDKLSLHKEMLDYHKQAPGIPEYINMLEDAQKRSMEIDSEDPITDKTLLTIASTAMLETGQFPEVVRKWEERGNAARTWQKWKEEFRAAQVAERRRLQATGGSNSFAGGDQPNYADVCVFGCLKAIDRTAAWHEIMAETAIKPWYDRMAAAVEPGNACTSRQ